MSLTNLVGSKSGRSSEDRAERILDLLVELIVDMTEIKKGEVETDLPVMSLGLSSVDLVALSGELEERLERSFSPTVFWEYPTLEALAEHLAEQ